MYTRRQRMKHIFMKFHYPVRENILNTKFKNTVYQ